MPPFGQEDKHSLEEHSTSSNDSNELKQVRRASENKSAKMEETNCSKDVVVDMCAENRICSSKKTETTSSTTSLHSCTCGPGCAPEKCDAGKKTTLVGWDEMRTKIFICLLVAFVVWAVIYIPISLTIL